MLHSFWYDEAEKTFSETTCMDPRCAMAYWGIAMSFYHPVWVPPTTDDLKKGKAAVEKAKLANAKTQRERDYIATMEAFYKDADKVAHHERALAWRNATAKRCRCATRKTRRPLFSLRLALLGTAPATDRTYSNQKQAAEILNRILTDQPNHPGIAHYMIHCYDSPQLAILALPAARSYARIAPAAPHALHMPSHIFTALGLWQDSIVSNLASAAAARSYLAKIHPAATSQDQLHAMDYLVYAYLQTCQDVEAEHIVEQASAVSKVDQNVFQAAYALAAIPARYALERRRWSAAASLELRPAGFPWTRFQYAGAITYFARALGAARSGNPSAARQEIEKLNTIQHTLAQVKQDYDWSAQVEVQRLTALAWVAHADGDQEEALRWMHSAADLEDKSDKHPVTPGPILPARELLGELFMELNQPAQALPEFDTVLRTSPKRLNATYGAARSAELSGDRNKTNARYSELLQLCSHADTQRLEVQNARAYVEKR